MARDPNCPARNRKCNACGGIGHLQSVAKQRNESLSREMTREGIIVGLEPINYQRIQLLANEIIMRLQLASVSLQVVVKLI